MKRLKKISSLKVSLKLIICLLLTSCESKGDHSGFENIIIDENLSSNLFDSEELILNPLTLKTESGYDNLPDSTLYIVKSNAIVNNNNSRLMRFAEVIQSNSDTLKLNIYETNPIYSQNFSITIVDNKFSSEFSYITSGPPIRPKIKRLEQQLILKSFPKQSSEMIYGRFYFKGICESDCDGDVEIEGDFKVEL